MGGSHSSCSCPVSQGQYNSVVNQRNSLQSQLNSTKKKLEDIQNEYNMLKDMCQNSGNVKEKAKEIFSLLQNRYLDRLTLVRTQQDYINKQNILLSNKDTKITDQDKTLENLNDKVQTNNRNIKYNMEDYENQSNILLVLKILFLILAITIIALLVQQYKS